jgi:hypothetical protein
MAFGRKKTGGRKRGTPNRITADVKAMILGALAAKGGQAYLEQQADKNPVAFLTLIGKVLPLQVSGEGGGPFSIEVVRFVDTGVRRAGEAAGPDC